MENINSDKKYFGNKIRALRLQKQNTVSDLQIYFFNNNYPITKKSIYMWERNELVPNLKAIKLLGNYYDVSIESLFNISKKDSLHVSKREAEFIFALRNFPNYKKLISDIINKEAHHERRD